jgi:hypothetical protein
MLMDFRRHQINEEDKLNKKYAINFFVLLLKFYFVSLLNSMYF